MLRSASTSFATAAAAIAVERQMSDDLGNLSGLHAMIERKFQVICQGDRLVSSDHCAERYNAPARDDSPGRFHTSPSSRSCVYLSRAGATI
jgi:hypothetical protein